MTQTVRQVIYDALRKIQVTAAGEVPNADEITDGLRALNNLMAGLKLEAIDTDWASVALDDNFPLPDEHIRGSVLMLSVELAPEYGIQIDPVIATQAERARTLLQAAYTDIPETTFETALAPRVSVSGRAGRYDITSDT